MQWEQTEGRLSAESWALKAYCVQWEQTGGRLSAESWALQAYCVQWEQTESSSSTVPLLFPSMELSPHKTDDVCLTAVRKYSISEN